MNELVTLLSEPSYRRLWLGEVISLFGDWFTYVAVSLLALEQGEGALAVAMVFVAHNLPHALCAPLAGILTDRFDRKKLMIYANYLQSALTLGLATAASMDRLVLAQILLFARISVSAIFLPAQTAALPRLVEKKHLAAANALTSATASIIFAAGVALGGIAVAFVGILPAILFDAFTFIFANIFLSALPPLPPAAARSARTDLREVFAYALERKPVLEALLAKTPLAFASGAAWVTLVQSAERLTLVTAGAMTLGLLHFARAFGSALGPLVHERLDRRASFLLTLAGVALLAATDVAALAFLGCVLWGVGITANWVRAQTQLQLASADALLGRLSAIDFFAFTAASSLGALLGALSPEPAWLGIGGAIVLWFFLHVLTKQPAKEIVC
jgi:MFS family permease